MSLISELTAATSLSSTDVLVVETATETKKVTVETLFDIAYDFDPALAAIEALTPSADTYIYYTGTDSAALDTITSYSRTLLDDTDAASWLSTLGVTSYIQTLVDDTDAASARTTLGLGTIATQDANNVNIDGGNIDGTIIGATTSAAGTFENLIANGNVDLGNAAADTLTITARVDSDIVPTPDSSRDLGSTSRRWANIWGDDMTLTATLTVGGKGDFQSTDSIRIPAGTTAQRDGSPAQGDVRFNTTNTQYEGYDGSQWGPLGGAGLFKGENGERGDTVNGAGDIFRVNEQTLNTDVTIDADENASCAGPLTIANGVTLTVSSGGNLVIV